jgi:hypothetical protein
MAWRAMTAEEMASRPEARLEGSLLLVVVCAATLAVTFVIAMLLVMVLIATGQMGRSLSGFFTGPAGLGALHSIPMLYLMVWAMAFSLMTLTRSPSTPGFAAGGLAGWVGLRLVISIAAQVWIASRYGSVSAGFIVQSVLPMLLVFVGEIMLVAGFWIYMREGDRPNGYYRRLIRVPDARAG